MKYYSVIFAVGFLILTVLYWANILEANLQMTAGFATIALSLYWGHRSFLDHHKAEEIDGLPKKEV